MPNYSTACARTVAISCLAGVPLAMLPGVVLEHDVTPKLVLLLFCAGGLLLLCKAWLEGLARLFHSRTARNWALLLGCQVLLLAVGTALSTQPALSFAGSAWRRYGSLAQLALLAVSLILTALVAESPKLIRPIFGTLTVTGAVVSIYAIAQYFGLDPLLSRDLYAISYYGSLARPPATLGHALYMGAFLAAVIPIALALAAASKGRRRTLLWTAVALMLAAIVLSGSRSSLLALICAVPIYFGRIHAVSGRQVITALAGFCGVVLAVLILLACAGGTQLKHRLTQWTQDSLGGPRLVLWRESLQMVAERPMGFGPETFANEFRHRQSRDLAERYPDFRFESPHNIVVETAFAYGIPGVLNLCGFVWLLFRVKAGRGGEAKALRASAAASFVALLFVTTTLGGALMLYGALALLIGLEAHEYGPVVVRIPKPRIRICAYCLAGVFLLCGAAYLIKESKYQAIAQALSGGDLDRAVNLYSDASAMWFPASGDDLWASRQFATFATQVRDSRQPKSWLMARAASERAEKTSDERAEALYQSALLELGANHAEAGEQKLREATAAAPTWYKAHLLMAQLYAVTGRSDKAASKLQEALELAGPQRTNLETAFQNGRGPQ